MRSRCARAVVAVAVLAAAARAGAQAGDPPAPASWGLEPAAAPEPAPAVPAPAPRPKPERRWRRPASVPRYLGAGLSYANVSSPAPGIGTRDGIGWTAYFEWEVTRWLDLGLRGGVARVRVGWTPNPADTDSPAELGFVGPSVVARLRPGRLVDPWIGGELAYQGVLWSDYVHSVTAWGLAASAGVDLHVWRWGLARLGASYSGFTATTTSGYGRTGPTPGPEDHGATASMRTLWLTASWFLDLGPAR